MVGRMLSRHPMFDTKGDAMNRDDELLELDRRIDKEDGLQADAFRAATLARWEFGRRIKAERDANGGKRLPQGRMAQLVALTGKKDRELNYRMQFADLCPTEQEVSQRVAELSSWRELVKSFAKPNAIDPYTKVATDYGSYINGGGPWQVAFLAAQWIGGGENQVTARQFADDAGVSVVEVKHRLAIWDAAARRGLVPQRAKLGPDSVPHLSPWVHTMEAWAEVAVSITGEGSMARHAMRVDASSDVVLRCARFDFAAGELERATVEALRAGCDITNLRAGCWEPMHSHPPFQEAMAIAAGTRAFGTLRMGR